MSGQVIRQTTIALPQWGGLEVPAIIAGEGVYFPIKYFCLALMNGLDDRPQRARIQRDAILRDLAATYPVQTPGGQQEMFCLERLGIGRWLDRIEPGRFRGDIGPRILQFQWDVTYAAQRLLWGEVESGPAPITTIIPADRALARRQPAPVKVRDEDARRYLLALAERVGHIEIDARAMQRLLLALADTSGDLPPMRCPQCGYALDGSEGDV